MKQITSKHAIWAGLLLCSALAAPANTMVTFWVDMSQQAASLTFNPATQTVSVHGSFDGWGAGVALAKSTTNDLVWTATYNVPTNGIVMEYKFVIDPSGYESMWRQRGNRLVTLPTTSGASLVLPKVFFSDVPSFFVNFDLVFRIDMSQQINVGTFNPSLYGIYARGNFNGWSTLQLTNDISIRRTNQYGLVTSNVYVGTYSGLQVSPGATMDYKFYIDTNAVWETAAPGTGDPGDNNNRFYSAPETDGTLTLPIVFFSDQPYAPVATNAVKFQVDMSAQVLAGNFDPSTGTVELRGNFNSWGGTQILCTNNPAAANTNLYTAVVTVVDGLGVMEEYKFWASVPANGGWETMANNRTFRTVSGASVVLPPVYFSNIDPRDLLPVETLVTFRVDMSKAATYPDNVPFNPAMSTNYFNGDCLTNGWYAAWGGFWPETQMFDDGTHGDAVAGDKIHTFQYLVPKGKTLRVAYKYGIDSADNEAPSNQNHIRYIRSTGTYVMPLDTFGNQFQEPQYGGPIIAKSTGGKVMISWLGYPGVQLATTDKLGGTWTNHPASDGSSSTNYPVGSGTLFFKLVKP